MKTLDDTSFDDTLRTCPRPVLVDFGSSWCGPCKQQRPVLEKFANGHPEIEVVEVDVDSAPKVVRRLGVQAMPTLMLFQRGELRAQARGLQSARRLEQLLETLDGT
jgi:thioredoxin 1